MLRNLKLGTKLIVVFLLVGLVPLGVISWLSVDNAKTAITEIMQDQLAYVRDVKKAQVEDFFRQKMTELNMLSISADAAIAYRALNAYLEDWDIDPDGSFDTSHEDYPEILSTKCGIFRDYIREYAYQDIYLIHGEFGQVLYSSSQGKDLGTNLATGEYSQSALARLWKEVRATKTPVVTDYERYKPLDGRPAMFAGGPLLDANGNVISVVAIQIPQDQVDAILQDRDGLGETGEAYLVGLDRLLRSNSLRSKEPSALTQQVSEQAVTDVYAGTKGSHFVENYRGRDVLSAYTPVSIEGLKWSLLAEVESRELFAPVSETKLTIVFVSAVLSILVFLAGLTLSRQISKPIRGVVHLSHEMNRDFGNLAEVVDSISENDLTKKIEDSSREQIVVTSNDEIGELQKAISDTQAVKVQVGRSIGKMVSNLTAMVRKIQESAGKLASATSDVARSSDRIATGGREQSDRVGQVSSAVEEMAAAIAESSKNAAEATAASEKASSTATSGGDIVRNTIAGMTAISEVVEDSANSIKELARSAEQIGEIITVINDIADQTNLLALNAAIEAARAGEQGRGFAVVADEVRKLAERTGKATGEIGDMIKTIQAGTSVAVESMSAGTDQVKQGQELADQAGQSLSEIVGMSQNVMRMVEMIATASEQQSLAAGEIAKNVESFTESIGRAANEAEGTVVAVETLNQLADDLQGIVGEFKTAEEQV